MILILFILGLIFGSFIGALSFRLPLGISISKGRSFCPNCKNKIAAYDNIPLISYLLLQGKCRHCHQKISFREPIIELVTAVIFIIVGFNPLNLFLASLLITIFVIDLEHQIIPDELVFIGLLILIFKFFVSNSPFFEFLLAGFLSALLLLTLNLLTKGQGMGLGDVKLALLIGLIVGLNLFLIWLFFSFAAGALVGVVLIALKKTNLKYKIAFGPFLIIGLILTIYFGQNFLSVIM